jgi:hypothetical protein
MREDDSKDDSKDNSKEDSEDNSEPDDGEVEDSDLDPEYED